jgi:hypothetical protein
MTRGDNLVLSPGRPHTVEPPTKTAPDKATAEVAEVLDVLGIPRAWRW